MIMHVTRVGEEMSSEALPEGEGRGKDVLAAFSR